MSIIRGNAIVGQSGGPTAVINQSLVGVIQAAKNIPEIENLYGARHGVKGILGEDFIDLFKEDDATLELVAGTPSSALGSVRKKPTKDECLQMFEVMRKHNIRYFFYIGGNDSAETTHIVNLMAKEAKYELRAFHIPKTVDNDLKVTDHCPGFGSAAKFVASAFIGDNLDNRALPGVKINIIMGRHAGFLTAASALAKVNEDDGPHLIYVPERPFTREQFKNDVKEVYDRLGRCVVAMSEGVVDANTDHKTFTEVILEESNEIEKDTHGNIQLSGSGALGDWFANYLKAEIGGGLRVRADTLGYLQRSFPGVVSEVDALEARTCGQKAVEFAASGDIDGSVAMIRSTNGYSISYIRTELCNVAKETTSLSDKYINEKGNGVTKDFIDYIKPIVGDLPKVGYFKGMKK